jgi:hypothetical protein
MKARGLSLVRAALLACCCGLAACQNGSGAAEPSAGKSTAATSSTTVLQADSSGAAAGTHATTGGNIITVDPSGNPSVPLERQLWWGMTHAAHKISAADLVRLNAGNAPRQREAFMSQAGRVRVTEYGALDGEFAARYVFAVLDAGGTETGSIALTSFTSPTQIARELGRIGEDERLYHLEDYRQPDKVGLLAAYDDEPAYEIVRTRVLTVLSQ